MTDIVYRRNNDNKDVVVAIEYKEKTVLGTSADVDAYNVSADKVRQKAVKVLVLSENSSDIFMIKKILPKEDGYKIYEVSTLSEALKVLNYLSLDLILVDDMLSGFDGYASIDKLNKLEVAKDIPKILLLTQEYKLDKRESINSDNFDFVKKPFDAVIFKLRVKLMLKHNDAMHDRKSYFKRLAHQSFLDAQASMDVYQEIFESNEQMMCIYDANLGKVVEANAIFEKFFVHIPAFNRIISHDTIARKFVPLIDEANYLNYYAPSEWMQTLIEGVGFTYLVKVKRDCKEYSFNIALQRMDGQRDNLYLIKLFNIYDYLPTSKPKKSETKLPLKEQNLTVFKEDFLELREAVRRFTREDKEIETLLYKMSSKLSIVCDDVTIVNDYHKEKEINVYLVIAELLKQKFMGKNIYINNQKVDKFLEEGGQEIYLPIRDEALYDLVFGILNNYYGSTFNSSTTYKRLDIMIHKDEALHIVLKMDKSSNDGVMGNLLSKMQASKEELVLPKSVKQALKQLHGEIEKVEEKGAILFNIKIAL
jgi:CheY-like chemotaxis protein